jgi:hypothetical protein
MTATEQVPVPEPGSDESTAVMFAHTYHGYELHGGLEELAELVQRERDRWEQTGELSDDVDILRACLFYEVRAHRHSGGYSNFAEQPFTVALMTRIRSLSGGTVPLRNDNAR